MDFDSLDIKEVSDQLDAYGRKKGTYRNSYVTDRKDGPCGDYKGASVYLQDLGRWEYVNGVCDTLVRQSFYGIRTAFFKWIDAQPWGHLVTQRGMEAEDGNVQLEITFRPR